MPVADLKEAKEVDPYLHRILTAATPDAALVSLRSLWVERLDFGPASGAIALHKDGLPAIAARIASRDGVHIVAVILPSPGRVLTSTVRDALKEVRSTLGGDVLLVASNADRSEWHFVYPSDRAGQEVLRRMVVRRDEPRRTVVEQLSGVYDNAPRMGIRAALDRAYDVEAVTKRFFQEYRLIFDQVMGMVLGLPDQEERRRFCQALFNRLMFLYFLQRKGWLTFNSSRDYLDALWKDAKGRDDDGFYHGRLQWLFFHALANPRGQDPGQLLKLFVKRIGQVPFLNGGLFEETVLDKRPGVEVPDEAIGRILHDLFARFNFTITESTPYDVEVAVDPEMLGKVFENLVTGRHESGSYYTPRPIVTFMCREALKGYLTTRVPNLTEEAAAAFVDDRQAGGISMTQASNVLAALERITVVDPACGSGAYLLGMLHELVELRCLLYSEKLKHDAKSLYGVDIDDFAVNIAKLRLWLSLIIEYEDQGDPPPLPNLDFKIVCGDSLLAPDPGSTLQTDMFLREAHEHAAELARLKERFLHETGEEKYLLERQIAETRRQLTHALRDSPSPKDSVDWRVEFAEVFDQNGGFDVALANPPYVRHELIKEIKPALSNAYGALYSGTADLYVFFYYRALQLLKQDGALVFISSNKWLRAGYGEKLRVLLTRRTSIVSISDFGDLPVFQTATAYPMMLVAQVGMCSDKAIYTEITSLDPPYPDIKAIIDAHGEVLLPRALSDSSWSLAGNREASEIEKIKLSGKPLLSYVEDRVYFGLKTGLSKAFVIDSVTRARILATNPECAEIIRPLASGREIHKWHVNNANKWLIVTRIGVEIERYPAVFRHLSQWKQELEQRSDQGNHWWELRPCAYYDAFDRPKIVYQVFQVEPAFAFDTSKIVVNNSVYIVSSDDLYLLGVLNSKPFWSEIARHCTKIQNGRQLMRACVGRCIVPDAPVPDRTTIADLVQQCLDAKGQGPEVSLWEAEINARVAKLYGL